MKYWFVKGVDLLEKFRNEGVRGNQVAIQWKESKSGARAEFTELNADHLYLVGRGEVGLVAHPKNQQPLIVAGLSPGDILGVNWKAEELSLPLHLRPLGEPEVFEIEPEEARKLLEGQQIEIYLRRGFRKIRLSQSVLELVRVDPVPRVAALLLKLARGFGREDQGRIPLLSIITPHVITRLTGLSRELTYLILAALRREEIIGIESGRITIESRVRLAILGELADSDSEA